jgi:hypothetical protein
MSGNQVQLKKVVTVTADQIKTVTVTTVAGVVMNVRGPGPGGEPPTTAPGGGASILSAADYATALVAVA